MKSSTMPSPGRAAWAAKQAAEVREQINGLQRPRGSNWRPYADYERTLRRLLAKESRLRLIAATPVVDYDPLPF